MKDSIFIPQSKLMAIAPKISWRACFVLNYILGWQLFSNNKVKKLIWEGEEYLWIHYPTLSKDLPLIRTKNKVLIAKIIDELVSYHLIKKYKAPDNTVYVRVLDLGVALYNLPIRELKRLDRLPRQHNTSTIQFPFNTSVKEGNREQSSEGQELKRKYALQVPSEKSQEEKVSKKIILDPTPEELDRRLKDFLKSPERKLRILSVYYIVSRQKILNKQQFQNFMKRNWNLAVSLTKQNRTASEILTAMAYFNFKKLSWTLETIERTIADIPSWISRFSWEGKIGLDSELEDLKHFLSSYGGIK